MPDWPMRAPQTAKRTRMIRGRRLCSAAAPPSQSCLDEWRNDAATQLNPRNSDGRMLGNFARNSFEFCFCG